MLPASQPVPTVNYVSDRTSLKGASTLSTVTAIKSGTTTACAYNHGGCTAFAITVGGDSAAPACSTFVSLDARGGLPVAEGHIGACQRLECVHNTDLMCTADAVTIGTDTATCLSYETR